MTKILRLGIYCVFLLLFLIILRNEIKGSVFEQDLLWFIPVLFRDTEGFSLVKLAWYVLNPLHLWFEIPDVKIYTLVTLFLFGPLAKSFIYLAMLFHISCSILLYFLAKNLGLNSRVSFLSSLMYLMLFAHFHAYMWPMAFQHLIVVFFILSGLIFYLKTNNLISSQQKYHGFFFLTLLVALLSSFCRLSILILPAMIMTHILVCSKDRKDMLRKYDIWLPLFFIYLFYPLLRIVSGDVRFGSFLRPVFSILNSKGITFINFGNNNLIINFFILLSIGILFIFLLRLFLRHQKRPMLSDRAKLLFLTTVFLAVMLAIASGNFGKILIPYNFIVPFMGMLNSFLFPLQSAMSIDSFRPYHFIPAGFSVFSILLFLFMAFIFAKAYILKQRQNAVLVTWYIFSLIYLYLWNPTASRYFVYLSALFCLIFCSVFDYLYAKITTLFRPKAFINFIMILIFAGLLMPNLAAIKIALYRGKTANNFYIYDYIKIADTVREDISSKYKLNNFAQTINLYNINPIVFTNQGSFSAADRYNDNINFVFKQRFNKRFLDVVVGQPADAHKLNNLTYGFKDYEVFNREGEPGSRFLIDFYSGRENLRLGKYEEAEKLLTRAASQRPYLLNFILGNLQLDDLFWITGARDLNDWVRELSLYYRNEYNLVEHPRIIYITQMMNKEIGEYMECLFYLSFLKNLSGNIDESKYWFSKIRFLENDFSELSSFLGGLSLVKSDEKLFYFLNIVRDTALYVRPENYADRFKFEGFIFRVLFKL
ncbi:MAG: hypothetical protein Q7J72_02985 [Candidatus Omnitrophota bacterium]|nr:hypothetical protein [Candidatus Omnitrophota bacterium]